MKRILKFLGILLLLIVIGITLIFFFKNSIAKYMVEKYCVEWTGRKITLGGIKINTKRGSIYLKDLKIYEANGDTVFFDCHDIYLRVKLGKLFDKVYEVEKIQIDNPEIRITQNDSTFNFDDLIKRFSSGKKTDTAKTPDTHYYIDSVYINNANVTYNNVPIHNVFRIHEMNLRVPKLDWDKPESKLHLDFNYGIGGAFNINLDVNRKTFAYTLLLVINNYDLSQYYTPLNTLVKVSSLKGILSTDLRIYGKFDSPEDFALAGFFRISDFELRDMEKRKLCGLHLLSLRIDTVNIKKHLIDIPITLIDKPYMAFDVYSKGNNMTEMVKEKEIHEIKDTAKGKTKIDYSNIFTLISSGSKAMGFLGANYHADSIMIRNGEFVFNDLSPTHRFQYRVTKINILTREVDETNNNLLIRASAALDDTGKFTLRASLHVDFKHKQFNYNVDTLKFSDVSPIAKYLLEKNSVKWIGRRITTGIIKVNAVKGSVFIKDIKIYEPDSTNLFFSCHDVYLRVNLKKMLENIYQVDNIEIDNPEISILQNGNHFNFDDLIQRFSSPNKQQDTTPGPQIHYDINTIKINHANITYNNVPMHNVFNIHDLNFSLPEISWNNPECNIHLDFNYGVGGFFNIDLDVNRDTKDYDLALLVKNYDLSQYYVPLTNYIRVSSLKGQLTTKLMLHGKFNNPKDISATGYIHVNDFEIKDSARQKVFALGELALNIDTINVKQNMYYLHNIMLDKPYMRFDYFSNGNNITHMIRYNQPPAPVKDNNTGAVKPDYSNLFTLLASSVKLMAIDVVNTNYHSDSIIIKNGQFIFNDYTLNNPFHYNVANLNISTDKISAATKSIQFNVSASLNDTGRFDMTADMGLDLKNMLLKYDVSNLRISDFNPYSEYYVGTPLEGYLNYKSVDSVINRNLKSSNVIHMAGVNAGAKSENKPVYKIPIRLALSLLKDEKDNIDIKIPANGNLDDPNYKIGPLVGRILSELIVKTAESPFRVLAKLFNKDPEDMKRFKFEYMQDEFSEKQLRKLDDVYKVLEKKKDLEVEITQVIDSVEEKDELALSLAKKKYFEETNRVANDSMLSRRKRRREMRIEDKIATLDTLFDKYLNDKLHLTGTELVNVQDKCIMLVGDTMLSRTVHNYMEIRNQKVAEFLIHKKGLPPKRVKVVMNKDSVKTRDTIEPEFDINYTAEDK
jgi:uncharacterized protein involved in outer membrane biogenesis